ncbi:MAG: GGDEF domain-containing phosphodiesterase [Clostridiales bacterium]|nr:GGDEF domain-containing phosphodiesterase [Clostridiales bacterium]
MEHQWSKAYKPKRKLYVLRSKNAYGFDEFCQENGYDWYKSFSNIYRPLANRALFYVPDKMMDEGYSRLCGGVEIGYSDMEEIPPGCVSITIPGFDVVDIKGFDISLIEDIPRLMTTAYSYAKLYIETEKMHVVSNHKLPYVCYMESADSLCVEIPVWSKKTKTEEMLTLDNMSKRDLYEIAYREPATGYYNWTWLKEKLEQCEYIGLDQFIFARFDVKGFRLINNVMGRDVAKELFRYICDAMSNQDWIIYSAKCERDVFAMIIKYMPEEEIINRLYSFFEEIGQLPSNKKYKVFYSCGLVFYDEFEKLSMSMRLEDMAQMAHLQCIKTNVNEIKIYTSEMKKEYIMAQQYKLELPDAIENEDLMVYLQPKYNPQNDTLTGAEALIRWFYKGGDMLSPKYFVPQFEADGTIDIIDRYVLRKVCKKFKEWKELGYPLYPISCNLSRHQISRPDLIYILCDIVDEYGVDHSLIDFEITESADFADVQYLIKVLNELKEKGFKISMDDFGTGYSSMALLKDMPLDIIKIDKSFIDGIATGELNNKDMLMTQDILAMSRHLGIKSLAEGVETFEQKEYLREWGCHYIQGYYYSKPIPISGYEYLLKKILLGQS